MVSFTILAGSFTALISAFTFEPGPQAGSPGKLTLASQSYAGKGSPSWIQRSPFNSSVLYAVNEVVNGQVVSFSIGTQGRLNLIDTISSGGNGPTHLLPLRNSKEVAVVNYYSGNALVATLRNDLVHFVKTPAPVAIPFTAGQGVVSHPHQVIEVGDQLFVADVGADRIWRLNRTSTGTWKQTGFITQPNNSGPRHMVARDGILYVLHETNSLLTSQTIPINTQTSSPFITASFTTPPGVVRTNYAAGEIRVSQITNAFPDRFIYVSNRKIGGDVDPRGDTIAIFRLEAEGKFTLVKEVHTGLQTLRSFIIDPSGKYIVAGGSTSGGVRVFERIKGGADLVQVARNEDGGTSSSFVWL